MPLPATMISFSANTRAKAAEVNTNFGELYTALATYVVFKDVASTTSVAHTFSASPILSAQNALTFSHATAEIIPGATSLSFRNTADSATNLSITDAGLVTVRAGLIVSAAGIEVSGAVIIYGAGITCTTGTFSGAVSVANGLIVSSGATSLTGGLTVVTGGIAVSADGVAVVGNSTFTGTLLVSGLITGNAGVTTTIGTFSGAITTTQASLAAGNVLLGIDTIATGTSNGPPRMTFCSGTPTGTPSNATFLYDATAHKLWIHYGGTWRGVAVT